MQETDVPEVAIPFVIFSMCVLGLLGFSARYWIRGLMLWASGQPVLPQPEPRRIQVWGFVDLIFAFLCVLVLQLIGAKSGVQLGIGSPPSINDDIGLGLLAWISAIQTLAVFFVSAFIAMRCRVKMISIGWSVERLAYDIQLGVKAFIVLAPLVYMLMIVVTWLSGQEYKHPIHEMASEDPWMLLPAIFMAVILAPLGEEFAFRVLLQGFLESLSIGRFSIPKFLFGRATDNGLNEPEVSSTSRGLEGPLSEHSGIDDSDRPLLSEVPAFPGTAGDSPSPIADAFRYEPTSTTAICRSENIPAIESSLPWWPIMVSGLLFGLAHFEYGMSWIPLTILGIALGWLYRVTNRIWPSLVVHFCVNAMSMIGFSLTVLFGDPTKAIP